MADKITVSEALTWAKTLKSRYEELVSLRNNNAHRERIYHATNSERDRVTEPLYDPKALDRQIALLAREQRLLDESIKRSNATVELKGYLRDDAVLGELA